MSQEIKFRGYDIRAESYQDDDTNKWIPHVIISPVDETPNNELPMSWEREFDTQEEADSFALDGAEFYIDNHF